MTDQEMFPDPHNIPYWIRLAIWPFIRSTTCAYCHFIRGFGCGIVATAIIGGATWFLVR